MSRWLIGIFVFLGLVGVGIGYVVLEFCELEV